MLQGRAAKLQWTKEAAQEHGVPFKLLNDMFNKESRWDANAVSSKGATGVGQLMPGTAKAMGVTNPKDPQQNIMGSAKYLKEMLDKFKVGGKPNFALALAGYNWGPSNLRSELRARPWVSREEFLRRPSVPTETKRHIRSVLDSEGRD